MKWFLIIVFCGGGIAYAQDIKQDFLTVYQSYQEKDFYTQEVTMQSFAQKGDRKPAYKMVGKVIKGKDCYYSDMEGKQTIINHNHLVFINEEAKQILYSDQHKPTVEQNYQQLLDSASVENAKCIKNAGNIKTYQITYPNQAIHTTEITLDMKMKVIKEIIYHYQQNDAYHSTLSKVIITYDFKQTMKPDPKWFDWEQVIKKGKKGVVQLQTAYQGYELIKKENKTLKKADLYPTEN
jgi:hypothetical protein